MVTKHKKQSMLFHQDFIVIFVVLCLTIQSINARGGHGGHSSGHGGHSSGHGHTSGSSGGHSSGHGDSSSSHSYGPASSHSHSYDSATNSGNDGFARGEGSHSYGGIGDHNSGDHWGNSHHGNTYGSGSSDNFWRDSSSNSFSSSLDPSSLSWNKPQNRDRNLDMHKSLLDDPFSKIGEPPRSGNFEDSLRYYEKLSNELNRRSDDSYQIRRGSIFGNDRPFSSTWGHHDNDGSSMFGRKNSNDAPPPYTTHYRHPFGDPPKYTSNHLDHFGTAPSYRGNKYHPYIRRRVYYRNRHGHHHYHGSNHTNATFTTNNKFVVGGYQPNYLNQTAFRTEKSSLLTPVLGVGGSILAGVALWEVTQHRDHYNIYQMNNTLDGLSGGHSNRINGTLQGNGTSAHNLTTGCHGALVGKKLSPNEAISTRYPYVITPSTIDCKITEQPGIGGTILFGIRCKSKTSKKFNATVVLPSNLTLPLECTPIVKAILLSNLPIFDSPNVTQNQAGDERSFNISKSIVLTNLTLNEQMFDRASSLYEKSKTNKTLEVLLTHRNGSYFDTILKNATLFNATMNNSLSKSFYDEAIKSNGVQNGVPIDIRFGGNRTVNDVRKKPKRCEGYVTVSKSDLIPVGYELVNASKVIDEICKGVQQQRVGDDEVKLLTRSQCLAIKDTKTVASAVMR